MHPLLRPLDLKEGRKFTLRLDQTIKDSFREALLKIKAGNLTDVFQGICVNISDHVCESCDEADSDFIFLMSCSFVESYFQAAHPPEPVIRDYRTHQENDTLWVGDQRDARMCLVDFLISELESPHTKKPALNFNPNH